MKWHTFTAKEIWTHYNKSVQLINSPNKMIHSEKTGHTFWIDRMGTFQSAPTFVDNKVDYANSIPVSDWEGDDLTIEEFTEVISIFEKLAGSDMRYTPKVEVA
mgnify:FL=1